MLNIYVMRPDNLNMPADFSEDNSEFFKPFLNLFPEIIYLNQFDRPGDLSSFHNVWMNQPGLDFLGYTQEEIYYMGLNLFKKIVHPDDMAAQLEFGKSVYQSKANQMIFQALRVKSRYQKYYSKMLCNKVVKETFRNGYIRQVLVRATDLTTCLPQLITSLKVIRGQHEEALSILTNREKVVLHLVVEGKTNAKIAEILKISVATAKKHRENIIEKTDVHNSAELVRLAVESGEY